MKWRGFVVFLSLVIPLLTARAPSSLGGPIYQWTDAEGNVGFTDDPARIPEKYRRNAILENSIPPAAERKGGAPPPEAPERDAPPLPSEGSGTDDAGHDQLYWRERIERLRIEQEGLIQRRTTLEGEADALSNPLTSSRIEQRERFQEIQTQLAELNQKISDIENKITVVIPEEARKLNAPPGWLRE
jgi:hypothetical protein